MPKLSRDPGRRRTTRLPSRRPTPTAKTADRTLDVFELFAAEQRPLNLSEIAERLRIPLSSSHALIKTLQARGYLYDLGRRQGYFPTTRMEGIVGAIAHGPPLFAVMKPTLSALRDETGETVVLAKRQGDEVIYVEVFESARTVRFSSVPGEVKPLHSTASGKAVLSCLAPAALDEVLARLSFERRTDSTIVSARQLKEQVVRGRSRGWFQSIAENVPDLMAISAPLRMGGEVYAITIGGPTGRFRPQTTSHVAALLRTSAQLEGTQPRPVAGAQR